MVSDCYTFTTLYTNNTAYPLSYSSWQPWFMAYHRVFVPLACWEHCCLHAEVIIRAKIIMLII